MKTILMQYIKPLVICLFMIILSAGFPVQAGSTSSLAAYLNLSDSKARLINLNLSQTAADGTTINIDQMLLSETGIGFSTRLSGDIPKNGKTMSFWGTIEISDAMREANYGNPIYINNGINTYVDLDGNLIGEDEGLTPMTNYGIVEFPLRLPEDEPFHAEIMIHSVTINTKNEREIAQNYTVTELWKFTIDIPNEQIVRDELDFELNKTFLYDERPITLKKIELGLFRRSITAEAPYPVIEIDPENDPPTWGGGGAYAPLDRGRLIGFTLTGDNGISVEYLFDFDKWNMFDDYEVLYYSTPVYMYDTLAEAKTLTLTPCVLPEMIYDYDLSLKDCVSLEEEAIELSLER
ncbi:MAG: hypothetical protein AB9907_04110 [Flexilinea sp.]